MPRDDHEDAVDRESLVSDLLVPQAYPHAAASIRHIETHTADVFLAGDLVYKIKKPVNFGFCDFSTLEKRRHFTLRELELNQALSSGVYLGVSEVSRTGRGRHAIDGQGETVEYALKMRRLAAEDSLDALVSAGEVDAELVRAIARKVALFHSAASAPGPDSDYWSLPTVRRAVMSNIDRLDEFAGVFVEATARAAIRGYADAWLTENGGLIDRRHHAGIPRECHGDLHAGNIFLERGTDGETVVQVIDCVEFNDSLRIIDPVADIAFLLMDLRRPGRQDLADAFLDEYLRTSGDAAAHALLPFYMSYRAAVRCMANALIAGAAVGKSRDRAAAAAREYLDVAADVAAADLPDRLLVVMAGMTGVGKSTVARLLSTAWSLEHLQTDVIRKELAGLDPMARTSGAERQKLYSRQMSRRTYAELERRAVQSLETARGAVMDGTYLGREFRRRAVEMGRHAGAQVVIVECTLAEETVLRRLAERYDSSMAVSEGNPAVYAMQKHQWERVSDDEAYGVARVDTGLSGDRLATQVFTEAWGAALKAVRRAV